MHATCLSEMTETREMTETVQFSLTVSMSVVAYNCEHAMHKCRRIGYVLPCEARSDGEHIPVGMSGAIEIILTEVSGLCKIGGRRAWPSEIRHGRDARTFNCPERTAQPPCCLSDPSPFAAPVLGGYRTGEL